mgnify:CR=1 FL=1
MNRIASVRADLYRIPLPVTLTDSLRRVMRGPRSRQRY